MLEEISGQYTTKDKKIITNDWEAVLKPLKKYKNLYINNRIGPLVVGIYLKMGRLNTFYTPIYYVHNLCRTFPCLTLTLSIEGKMILHEKHNQMYVSEAESLVQQAYIAIDGNLSIDEIIAGYERYFISPNMTSYAEYEDLALICGWTKDKNKIEYALDLIYKKLKMWSEERYFAEDNGFENWFKGLEKKVWNGNELNSIVETELIKHKLEKTPERKILI